MPTFESQRSCTMRTGPCLFATRQVPTARTVSMCNGTTHPAASTFMWTGMACLKNVSVARKRRILVLVDCAVRGNHHQFLSHLNSWPCSTRILQLSFNSSRSCQCVLEFLAVSNRFGRTGWTPSRRSWTLRLLNLKMTPTWTCVTKHLKRQRLPNRRLLDML